MSEGARARRGCGRIGKDHGPRGQHRELLLSHLLWRWPAYHLALVSMERGSVAHFVARWSFDAARRTTVISRAMRFTRRMFSAKRPARARLRILNTNFRRRFNTVACICFSYRRLTIQLVPWHLLRKSQGIRRSRRRVSLLRAIMCEVVAYVALDCLCPRDIDIAAGLVAQL